MMMKTHYYSSTVLSPWPLLISFNAFNLLVSMVMLMKFMDYTNLVISMTLLAYSSLNWWGYYSKEFNEEGSVGSYNMHSCVKNSMILFISSEVLFFFSFFWAYYHFMVSPEMETSTNWPPDGVLPFNYLNVPMINTLILLSSGVTVTLSHNYLTHGKLKKCSLFLNFTIVLGILFTVLQSLEYKTSFFSISDSTFGSSFFMLTGFHGIHVMVGFIFLLIVAKNMAKVYAQKNSFLSFELSSWYWHFVDVIWIKVYFLLYFLNS